MEPLPDDQPRTASSRAAHGAVVAASLGDRALADTVRPEIEATTGDPQNARDSAIAAAALACCKILDHDEAAATSAIADHLARHPLTDARGEAHLRRNLAIAYVASDRRAPSTGMPPSSARCTDEPGRWPASSSRPGRAASIADTELGSPSTVVTSLPLAWSVELAVRASAAGCPDGSSLLPNARGVAAGADPPRGRVAGRPR